MRGHVLWGLLLLLGVDAISYRCDNNQVLIVQNFGNDTIRMHCQRLNICGFDNLNCEYEHQQHTCGGKYNFVAHVNQQTATGPVEHTCCLLKQKEEHLSYDNDCFVYELPDGSHSDEANTNGTSKSDDGITVLKNANQIPEQFDGYVGYRMRLFMLRNKSPPTLIVKAIERVPAGYRVTICRPRCGKFANEGVGEQVTVTKEQETKVPEGDEWAAAAWSSWQTSTWSTWSKTTWSAWEEASAENSAGVRSRAHRLGHDPKGAGPTATAISSAKAENGQDAKNSAPGNGGATPVINNNVHVHAEGGKGGEGGQAHIQLPDEKETKDNEKNVAGDLSGGQGRGRFGPAHSDSDLAGDLWNLNPVEKKHGQRKNKKWKNAKKAKWDEEEEDEDETTDSDEEREESAEKRGKKLIDKKRKNGKSKNGDNDIDKVDKEDQEKGAVDGGTDEDGGVGKDQSKGLKSNPNSGNAEKTGKKGKGKTGKGPVKGDDEDKDRRYDSDEKEGVKDDNGDVEGKPKGKSGKAKGKKESSPSQSAKKGKKDKGKDDKHGLKGNGKDNADSDNNTGDKNGQNIQDDKDRNGKKKENYVGSPSDAGNKEKGRKHGKGKDDAEKDVKGEDARNDGAKYGDDNETDNSGKGKGKGGNDDNDEKTKERGKGRNQGKKDNSGDTKTKDKDGKKDEHSNKNKASADSGKDDGKNSGKSDKSALKNGEKKSSKTVDGSKKKASGDAEKDGKNKPISKNNDQDKSGKESDKMKGSGKDVAKDGETEKKSPKPLRRNNGRLSTHDEGTALPEDSDGNGDDSENVKWTSSEEGDKASKERDGNNHKSGETEEDNGKDGDAGNGMDRGKKSGEDHEEGGNGEGKKNGEGNANGGSGDGKDNNGNVEAGVGNKGGKTDGGNNEENKEANALTNKESEEDDRTDEKSSANPGKRNRGPHGDGDSDRTNEIGDDGGFKQGGDENDKQGTDADAKSEENEEEAEGTNGNEKETGDKESKFSGIINEKEPADSDESVEKSSEKTETTTNGKEKETTSEGGFVVEVNAGVGTKSGEDSQEEGDEKDGVHKGKGDHEIGDHSGEEHHGEEGDGGEAALPWCDELETKTVAAESSGESIHEASGQETLGTGFTGIISEFSGEEIHSGSGEEAQNGSGEEIAAINTQKCRNRPAKETKESHSHHKAHGHRSHNKPVPHRNGKVHSPPRPAPNAPPRDPNVLQWQDSPGPDSFLASMRSCFSGDTMVRTILGDKKMEELQVGDYVLVPSTESSTKYERVELFYHREPETYVKFVQLNTESGKSLSLTQLHLLPFGDCEEMEESIEKGEGTEEWIRKSKFSYKAQKGECLLTLDSEGRVFADKISKVGRRLSKGIYSPVTVEGAIVTNGILTSCFSQLESHSAQKMAFDLLIRVYHTFGYLKGAAHAAVQEVPIMLDYVHQLSWYILPFAKY